MCSATSLSVCKTWSKNAGWRRATERRHSLLDLFADVVVAMIDIVGGRVVRQSAPAAQVHYGAKKVLMRDCFQPLQDKTIQGVGLLNAEKAPEVGLSSVLVDAVLHDVSEEALRIWFLRRGASSGMQHSRCFISDTCW